MCISHERNAEIKKHDLSQCPLESLPEMVYKSYSPFREPRNHGTMELPNIHFHFASDIPPVAEPYSFLSQALL